MERKIQPEHIRRAWANKHAELQIFKLKVLVRAVDFRLVSKMNLARAATRETK